MNASFITKFNEVDCAQKYLHDIQMQFEGWTVEQILEYFAKESNLGEYNALKSALSCLRNEGPQAEPKASTCTFSKAEQLEFDLFKAMPEPPVQTQKQKLQASTALLPSIVSFGYRNSHKGINWPHFENMLKLYALGFICRGALTPQQQKDKEDLSKAIEEVGNAKYKKKHLSAEQIIKRSSKSYLRFGQDVIYSLTYPDKGLAASLQDDLELDKQAALNPYNQKQLDKVEKKATDIVRLLRDRYSGKN